MADNQADVLENTGPALSATSDAPTFTRPANDGATTETVDPKPDAAKADNTDKPEGDAGRDSKVVKTDDTPPGVKREITLERNRRRAAEERAAQLEADNRKLMDALPKKEPERPAADPRPTRDTFNNPDAYDEALIDWSARQARQEGRAEAEQSQAQRQQQAANKALADTWTERKAQFEADHPDYAEVAEADSVQISMPMAAAIMRDEDGPAIAYYLGQHPEEAARIATLDGFQAASAIGRIAARLGASPPPAPKPKPDPIRPVGGRSNAGPKSPDEMSMDEYAADRVPPVSRKTH